MTHSVAPVSDSSYRKIDPPFSSPVVDLVVSLNNLRDKRLNYLTLPYVFFQIKDIFQMVESLESARIEGNHTTLADYVSERLKQEKSLPNEQMREIINIQNAMGFIEDYFKHDGVEAPISRMFISQLHKMVVENLQREGDRTPGDYRKCSVKITNSDHEPPDYIQVPNYMEELIEYINETDKPKYDLLKTAIAHHRFTWIHPFSNGNGRTVRLLTYAMLIKQGFNVAQGRILNPTAVFCNNRDKYNAMLSLADTGSEEGKLAWCEYVLGGLKTEIEKIDQLLSYNRLKNNILLPALKDCFELKKIITDEQYDWLKLAIEKESVKANDFKEITPTKDPKAISRKINKLKEMKLLTNIEETSRKYYIDVLNNRDFIGSIIHQLREHGFVPKNL